MAIFAIAKGSLSTQQAIAYLLEAVSWDSVNTLPIEVSTWFILPPVVSSTLEPSTSLAISPTLKVSSRTGEVEGATRSTPLPQSLSHSLLLPPFSDPSIPGQGSLDAATHNALRLLRGFSEGVQAAATSTSVVSTFPPSLLVTVALSAIGLNLDQRAVTKLIEDLPRAQHLPSDSNSTPSSSENVEACVMPTPSRLSINDESL
jgi:hypothetical protein